MKIFFFIAATLVSIAATAQQNCVSVKQISTDYQTNEITFSMTWNDCAGDASYHRNTAWVFVDYRPATATGGDKGEWTRATISSATVSDVPVPVENVISSGISQGVWINGANSSMKIVKLTLDVSAPMYDWCAFATDFPPKAVENLPGNFTFKGTPPFYVTYTDNNTVGTFTERANQSLEGNPSSLTDATGCPGVFGTLCGLREIESTWMAVNSGLQGGWQNDYSPCPSRGWDAPNLATLTCICQNRIALGKLTEAYVYMRGSSQTNYVDLIWFGVNSDCSHSVQRYQTARGNYLCVRY